MAHYAFLDESNIVTEVITGIDETETIEGLDTETWYGNFRGQVCKRTSYNNKIRKNYAGVGFTYDPIADVFIQPQPYPSWSLDSDHDWQAPTPLPDHTPGEYSWSWNEETLTWDAEEINDDPTSVV
jgi:hypothetical protein